MVTKIREETHGEFAHTVNEGKLSGQSSYEFYESEKQVFIKFQNYFLFAFDGLCFLL